MSTEQANQTEQASQTNQAEQMLQKYLKGMTDFVAKSYPDSDDNLKKINDLKVKYESIIEEIATNVGNTEYNFEQAKFAAEKLEEVIMTRKEEHEDRHASLVKIYEATFKLAMHDSM